LSDVDHDAGALVGTLAVAPISCTVVHELVGFQPSLSTTRGPGGRLPPRRTAECATGGRLTPRVPAELAFTSAIPVPIFKESRGGDEHLEDRARVRPRRPGRRRGWRAERARRVQVP